MPLSGKGVSLAQMEPRLAERLKSLFDIFEDFCNQCGHVGPMDTDIFIETVEQYFKASDRMKSAHAIPYTDRHKRAAYTIWAFNKYRPIRSVPGETKKRVLANELFALHAGLSHLKINIKNLSKEELDAILFNLHTQDINPDWLSIMMYYLEQRDAILKREEEQTEKLRQEIRELKLKK